MRTIFVILFIIYFNTGQGQSNKYFWQLLRPGSIIPGPPVRSNLIFENNADVAPPPGLNGYKTSSGNCCSYSTNQTDTFSREGSYSWRFELRYEDRNLPPVGGSVRTELNRPSNSEPVVNVTRWYAYSIRLRGGGSWNTDPAPEVCGQFHTDAAGSPPVALWSYNGRWNIARNGNPTYDLGPYTLDKWTDFVYRIKWDNTGTTGTLQVWMDGVQVVNVANQSLGYPAQTEGAYMKFGIYKWPWKLGNEGWGSTSRWRVAFYDAIRIGNQNATLADVSPWP